MREDVWLENGVNGPDLVGSQAAKTAESRVAFTEERSHVVPLRMFLSSGSEFEASHKSGRNNVVVRSSKRQWGGVVRGQRIF